MPNGNVVVAHERQLLEVDRNGSSHPFADIPPPYSTIWRLRWSPDSQKLRVTVGSVSHNAIVEFSIDGKVARDLLAKWKPVTDQLNWFDTIASLPNSYPFLEESPPAP